MDTDTWLYSALNSYPISGSRVLLMGSTIPWYESVCIVHEASECVTLEYNELQYDHPRITTVTVDEFSKDPKRYGKFDQVWSISSFEHDGLGRYGDPINPTADLAAMAKVMDYLKDDGAFMFSVPVGKDEVQWNAGRVYGRVRLPMMIEDNEWDTVDSFGFEEADFDRIGVRTHQPVFVLKKKARKSVNDGNEM